MQNHWPLIVAAFMISVAVALGMYKREMIIESAAHRQLNLVPPAPLPVTTPPTAEAAPKPAAEAPNQAAPALAASTPVALPLPKDIPPNPAAAVVAPAPAQQQAAAGQAALQAPAPAVAVATPAVPAVAQGQAQPPVQAPAPAQAQPAAPKPAAPPQPKFSIPSGPPPAVQKPVAGGAVAAAPAPAAAVAPAQPKPKGADVLGELCVTLEKDLGMQRSDLADGGYSFQLDGARLEAHTTAPWKLMIYNLNAQQADAETENFKKLFLAACAALGIDPAQKGATLPSGQTSMQSASKLGNVTVVRDPANGNSVRITPNPRGIPVAPAAPATPATPAATPPANGAAAATTVPAATAPAAPVPAAPQQNWVNKTPDAPAAKP